MNSSATSSAATRPTEPGNPPRTTELLSPAGDWDSLRAAVANGADAVYFGLARFNARHRATNFGLDELEDVVRYLHERGVRGYLTLNTLIFSDELPEVAAHVVRIAQSAVDAVIVQDLGLARLIRRLAPGLAVHGSTQMTLTEPRAIRRVGQLGVERVILARELSLDEIGQVAAVAPVPVEVFVHGALCVAYSGQCLTSEALGARSANRGQCAQACRLPYELVVDGQRRDLGELAYLLSPQDLAAPHLVERLVAQGVASLKIEGRLKSPQYVAATTAVYRSSLDAALGGRPFALSAQQQNDLELSYSRGFTPGFLEGIDHQRLVAGRFPKSRGSRVGTVLGTSSRGVYVVGLTGHPPALKPGDGLVFDQGHPEQDEQGGRVYEVRPVDAAQAQKLGADPHMPQPQADAPRQSVVEIRFGRGQLNLAAVTTGSLVWKTDDPQVRKRWERTYQRPQPPRPCRVNVVLRGAVGGPLSAELRSVDGRATRVEWPGPLERAEKHPLTLEVAQEQLGRLGQSGWELGEVMLDLKGEPLVPKSVLNDLRRRGVADLAAQAMAQGTRPCPVHHEALTELRAEARNRPATANSGEPGGGPKLRVLVRTLDQLTALCRWLERGPAARPELVYCDFEDVRRYAPAVAMARAVGLRIGLATLRVFKPGDLGLLAPIARAEPDVLLIRNLTALDYFLESPCGAEWVGDYALNAANELTAAWLLEQGLHRLVPSYDLNWEQLAALASRIDPLSLEVVIHQHMPLFHMEHCVFAHTLSQGKDWRDCGRPCDHHRLELRDRVGSDLPLVADAGCRNTVFNAVPQSAARYVPRMLKLGLRTFRVEMLREAPDEVPALVERYARVLAGEEAALDTWRHLQVLSQLGVTRGTLGGD